MPQKIERMSENQNSKSQQHHRGGGRGKRGKGKPSNEANHQERQRLYSECSEDHCAVCLNRLVIFAVGRCNHPGIHHNEI